MPYISSDEVKTIRTEIKKQFPEYKFSIRRDHHSVIRVSILEGPVNLLEGSDKGYQQVNDYYIDEHYPKHIAKMLNKIKHIATAKQREFVYDSDYGSVPTFYFHLNIGEWDKPYKIT